MGYAAVPFTALQGAHVHVDRVVFPREGGVAMFGAVHLVFVGAERFHDDVGGLDGVHAGLHLADVGGPAGHRDPGPDHADLGGVQGRVARSGFRDQHGVGAGQGVHHGQGAVAGALLFDHGRQLELGGRLQAGAAQGLQRGDIGRDPGLHVGGAAAIHAAVTDAGFVGRRRPQVGRTLRHHVHVALQQQAAAGRVPRGVDRDDIVAPAVTDQRWGPAGLAGQQGWIGRDAPGGQS